MNRKTKAWMQLIIGIVLLLVMLGIPEFAAFAFIVMIVIYIGKKLWHVPIWTIKRK